MKFILKILLICTLILYAISLHDQSDKCRSPELLLYIEKQAIWELFILALIEVESGGDSTCVGMDDDVGILQITPICIKEVNRILGTQKYTLIDRYSPKKSLEIFYIIQAHKNPRLDTRLAARIWNPIVPTCYYEKIERYIHLATSYPIIEPAAK